MSSPSIFEKQVLIWLYDNGVSQTDIFKYDGDYKLLMWLSFLYFQQTEKNSKCFFILFMAPTLQSQDVKTGMHATGCS